MLLEFYLLFQFSMFIFFALAFFFKSELFWALTGLKTFMLMYSSLAINIKQLAFDTATNSIVTQYTVHSFPFLLYFNLMFFLLVLVFGLLDVFDKYSTTSSFNKLGDN